MRIFLREFGYRYETYEFGYSTYCERESGDALADVYAGGFLPHSADPSVQDLFYMARGVRVPVKSSHLTSENRRVLKKFDGLFTQTILTKSELQDNAEFLDCFLTYFKERHGERVMSEERARGILTSPLPIQAVRYERDGVLAGYVLEVVDGEMSHYWYSCYKNEFAGTSFGMWLMLDALRRAQSNGREYLYLGTAYGAKGRYKTNFEPLEFWDGSSWITDTKLLKELIESLGT